MPLRCADLGFGLPAHVISSHAFCSRACGLIRLQDKLQSLAGQHADVLETLSPNVRKRVEFLREIQVGETDPYSAFHFYSSLM